MYAKVLFQRNNAGRPSQWATDSRKRSLVLRPLPLSYEERISKRRLHLAQLLLKGRISTGTFKLIKLGVIQNRLVVELSKENLTVVFTI